MEDPFLRLIELSKLSSPAHRAPQQDLKDGVHEQIFRCLCKEPNNPDFTLRTCTKCGCTYHLECLRSHFASECNDSYDIDKCYFCNSDASKSLEAKGVNLEQLSQEIKCNKYVKSIYKSSKYSKEMPDVFSKSSLWLSTLTARDDVYSNLYDLSNQCTDPSNAEIICHELQEERKLYQDLSLILKEISEDSRALESPVLDLIAQDIETIRPELKPKIKDII